jgi:hypothetical protein
MQTPLLQKEMRELKFTKLVIDKYHPVRAPPPTAVTEKAPLTQSPASPAVVPSTSSQPQSQPQSTATKAPVAQRAPASAKPTGAAAASPIAKLEAHLDRYVGQWCVV